MKTKHLSKDIHQGYIVSGTAAHPPPGEFVTVTSRSPLPRSDGASGLEALSPNFQPRTSHSLEESLIGEAPIILSGKDDMVIDPDSEEATGFHQLSRDL